MGAGMSSYSDDELEELYERYHDGEISFAEFRAICDQADREDRIDRMLEAQERVSRKGGWSPFASVGVRFDRD